MSDNHPFRNELGEVTLCKCGGLKITVGRVTLHIAPDEVEAFYQLGRAGFRMVRRQENGAQRRRRQGRLGSSRNVH